MTEPRDESPETPRPDRLDFRSKLVRLPAGHSPPSGWVTLPNGVPLVGFRPAAPHTSYRDATQAGAV